MNEELRTLEDIAAKLEAAGIDYILTGSVALNCYAQPRMTRDIDLVVALFLKDTNRIEEVLGPEYYVSPEAAREAVMHQTSFNAIHQETLIKCRLCHPKAGGLSSPRVYPAYPLPFGRL